MPIYVSASTSNTTRINLADKGGVAGAHGVLSEVLWPAGDNKCRAKLLSIMGF